MSYVEWNGPKYQTRKVVLFQKMWSGHRLDYDLQVVYYKVKVKSRNYIFQVILQSVEVFFLKWEIYLISGHFYTF